MKKKKRIKLPLLRTKYHKDVINCKRGDMYKSSLNKQGALLVIVEGKNENKIILLLITFRIFILCINNFFFFSS